MFKKNWLCLGVILLGMTACGGDYAESADVAATTTRPSALEEEEDGIDCDSICQCNRKCNRECQYSGDPYCGTNCRADCTL